MDGPKGRRDGRRVRVRVRARRLAARVVDGDDGLGVAGGQVGDAEPRRDVCEICRMSPTYWVAHQLVGRDFLENTR